MKPTTTPQGNVPYDVGAASLFDTAYVHPLLRDSFLPWWYYDRFAKWTTWLVSGTKAGLDQWLARSLRQDSMHQRVSSPPHLLFRLLMHLVFFNKSTKAMPYITSQYRKASTLNTLRSYIAQVPLMPTRGLQIDLAPWPQSITEKGIVRFVENGRPEAEVMRTKVCKPHVLILATGYTQSFPFLDYSYPLPKDANMRAIWKEGDGSVAFIGFVRPSFGKSITFHHDA